MTYGIAHPMHDGTLLPIPAWGSFSSPADAAKAIRGRRDLVVIDSDGKHVANCKTFDTGNCARCGGTGQYFEVGLCWDCGGDGKKADAQIPKLRAILKKVST